jgi:hypothetical protein
MKHTRTLSAMLLAMSMAPSAAWAQYSWGHAAVPRDGACFYKDADYRGDYFCIRAGEEVSSLSGGMNDRISSIRLYGHADVLVFRDPHFRGRSTVFRGNVRNLSGVGWNDMVSSIQVGYGRMSPGEADRIVRRAYQDVLGREPDPEGLESFRHQILDNGWTEARVRDALRNSPEYRDRMAMTPERAREVVRRAYLNVLKREPDPASSGYVEKVYREHWTQADVERELRKSPEYRKRR